MLCSEISENMKMLRVCVCENDTDPGEGYSVALCKTPSVPAQKHASPDSEMEIHTAATIKQQ